VDPARFTIDWKMRWDPAAFARALVRNTRAVASVVWDAPLLALAVVCLPGRRSRKGTLEALCGWLALVWVLGYLPVYVEYRYLTPALPLFLLAAAGGAEVLFARSSKWRSALSLAAAGLLASGVLVTAFQARRHVLGRTYDQMLLGAASAIRADGAPGAVAADSLVETLLLAYYADRVSVNILRPHPAAVIDDAARRFDIRYLLWLDPSDSQRRELANWTLLWSSDQQPDRWVLFRRR
jgi:hypothetical protein